MPVPLTAQRGGEIIDIPVPGEGKVIRSRLFEPKVRGKLGSIVLAHGLGDSAWSDLIEDGAEFLSEAGFRVLAPSLYGDDGDQRDLVDCDLTTHAKDLELATRYVRENHGSQPVFGIGHSFGGLAILLGNAQFDGAVMWDASNPKVPDNFMNHYHGPITLPDDRRQVYIQLYGRGIVLSSAMLEERYKISSIPVNEWSKKQYGIRFIAASMNSSIVSAAQNYHEIASDPKSLEIIEGADHHFTNPCHRQQLLRATAEWLTSLSYKL